MYNLNTKKIERHTIQEERFTYDRKRFYQPKDIFYIYGVKTITKNFFEKNNIPINTETINLVLYDTKVIESGAFCNCKYLYNVEMPNVEKLEGLTFASCKNLYKLKAEKLKTYKTNDFLRCPQQTNYINKYNLTA